MFCSVANKIWNKTILHTCISSFFLRRFFAFRFFFVIQFLTKFGGGVAVVVSIDFNSKEHGKTYMTHMLNTRKLKHEKCVYNSFFLLT